MNPYELADTVRRFTEQIKPTNNESDDAVVQGLPNWFINDLEKSVNMLRQQAQQIEALTDRLKWYEAKEMLTTNNHLGVVGVKPYGEF